METQNNVIYLKTADLVVTQFGAEKVKLSGPSYIHIKSQELSRVSDWVEYQQMRTDPLPSSDSRKVELWQVVVRRIYRWGDGSKYETSWKHYCKQCEGQKRCVFDIHSTLLPDISREGEMGEEREGI